MTVRRACTYCDNTGLYPKGFCQMCKGVGYVEVLEGKRAVTISTEEADLLKIVAKHTDSSQFTLIMNEYVQ